ncbi:hypothetical protein CC78DRAFT_582478 [Lojkania enalia]|uniref:Uncharacterized protein n=1 Tax=Lojkania enalia TaxID=147567 RepID=A0A9P4KAM1_9PLEO|nr:hypothetical protein CC78DRAFT_582478 [Didymosphaeria enalia]
MSRVERRGEGFRNANAARPCRGHPRQPQASTEREKRAQERSAHCEAAAGEYGGAMEGRGPQIPLSASPAGLWSSRITSSVAAAAAAAAAAALHRAPFRCMFASPGVIAPHPKYKTQHRPVIP